MSDLLTNDELAAMLDRAHDLRAARFFKEADWLFALLRHIAALEARTPAPATDVDAPLAEDGLEDAPVARAVMGAFWEGSRLAFQRFAPCGTPWKDYDHFRESAWRDSDSRANILHPTSTVEEAISRSMGEHWAVVATKAEQMPASVNTAPATDVEALLAEAERKVKHARAKLSALCHGRETFTMRIPADRTYDHDFAFADAFDACNDLAVALRESQRQVDALHEEHFQEMQRVEDALKEHDAAIARAEKAVAERDEERAAHDAIASICHEAGVDGGDGTSISLVRALATDLAAARAELGALGPVEYIRETNEHPRIRTYIQCIKDDIDALAIRVVKEATEAAELQAMQDAIKARAKQIRTALYDSKEVPFSALAYGTPMSSLVERKPEQ